MSHDAAKPPSFITTPINNTTYGPKTNIFVNSENPPPPPYTEEKGQQKRTTTIFGVRSDNVVVKTHHQQPSPPKQQFNEVIKVTNDAPRRVTLASRDSCSLPCSHYRPPANEIKTWWLFDGFREWCAYCNQLTKGENLVRTGDQLSGLIKNATSPWNRMDYDESSTSDLEMEGFNDLPSSPNFNMNFPMVDKKEGGKEKGNDLWLRSHQDDDREEAYDEGLKPMRERQKHQPRVHPGGVKMLDKGGEWLNSHPGVQHRIKQSDNPTDPSFWIQDPNQRTGNDFVIDDFSTKHSNYLW